MIEIVSYVESWTSSVWDQSFAKIQILFAPPQDASGESRWIYKMDHLLVVSRSI